MGDFVAEPLARYLAQSYALLEVELHARFHPALRQKLSFWTSSQLGKQRVTRLHLGHSIPAETFRDCICEYFRDDCFRNHL